MQTVLEMAEPVTLCWAAVILSVMLCPDILNQMDGLISGTQMSPAHQPRLNGSALEALALPDKAREGREGGRQRGRCQALDWAGKADTCFPKEQGIHTYGFNYETPSVLKYSEIIGSNLAELLHRHVSSPLPGLVVSGQLPQTPTGATFCWNFIVKSVVNQ